MSLNSNLPVSPVSTTALAASLVVSNKSGRLYSAFGYIDGSAATDVYYVQVFNTTSAPNDGTAVSSSMPTPIIVNHTTGTPTQFQMNFTDINGIPCSTGITICISTTHFTKTIAGSVASISGFYR